MDASKSTIQDIADQLVPPKAHRDFNFALIDLGSSVCRPAKPLCNECPLRLHCDYAIAPKEPPRSSLRADRLSQGFSLLELARRAGVSKLTLINIEAQRTKPRADTLRKISQALDEENDLQDA